MTDELFAADADTIAEFQQLMADPAARQAFVEAKARAAKTGAKVRYSHVLRVVSETPWAIRPSMLGLIVDLIAFRVAGGRYSAEELEQRLAVARRPESQAPETPLVAVLPLHGVIVPKASAFSDVSGGTSIEEYRGAFRQALANDAVKGIVMDVDSPGGMVSGVPELAAEIRAGRKQKPVVAIANHEAASAGYWLASQASEVYVTKSGRVGSIGVYTTHENRAGEAAAKGVERTLVSAGKYKTEGNPYEPLTDDALEYMQAQVDEFYGMFLADVAAGRGVPVGDVREGFGQGREVLSKEAVSQGMADGVSSLEAVASDMLAAAQRSVAAASVHTLSTSGSSVVPGVVSVTTDAMGRSLFTGTDWASGPEDEPTDVPEEATEEQVPEPAMAADIVAEVDNSAWDGNRAMAACSSAADYRSICAGEHSAGTPDERQHWALPHHYLGRGPNAAGVRNALARIGQTQDLTNRGAAQAHLDRHMSAIQPQAEAEPDDSVAITDEDRDAAVRRMAWEQALEEADELLDKE